MIMKGFSAKLCSLEIRQIRITGKKQELAATEAGPTVHRGRGCSPGLMGRSVEEAEAGRLGFEVLGRRRGGPGTCGRGRGQWGERAGSTVKQGRQQAPLDSGDDEAERTDPERRWSRTGTGIHRI